MYTVDYFIKKFEAIPEAKWLVMSRSDGYARCAYGWCYATHKEAKETEEGLGKISDEEVALTVLVRSLNSEFAAGGINNGIYSRYQQPTPKQRILAALYDVKRMQLPTYEDIRSSLAVLPIDETSDSKTYYALLPVEYPDGPCRD